MPVLEAGLETVVVAAAAEGVLDESLLEETGGAVVVVVPGVVAQGGAGLSERAAVGPEGVPLEEDVAGLRVGGDLVPAQAAAEAQPPRGGSPRRSQGADPPRPELREGPGEGPPVAVEAAGLLLRQTAVVVGELLLLVDQLQLQAVAAAEPRRVHQQPVHPLAPGGEEQLRRVLAAVGNGAAVVLEEVGAQAVPGAVVGAEVQQGDRRRPKAGALVRGPRIDRGGPEQQQNGGAEGPEERGAAARGRTKVARTWKHHPTCADS